MITKEQLLSKRAKQFVIVTPNLRNASSGGLIWIDKFAEYVSAVYKNFVIIDVIKLKPFIRKSRAVNILYYVLQLVRRNNAFFFIDHNLHMRLSVPLFISAIVSKNNYAVLTHHLLFNIRKNWLGRKLEYLSERLLLRNACKIIVPSIKTLSDIERMRIDVKKVAVIPPTCFYRNQQHIIRNNRNKLLFVGNLEPRKGLEVLINAVSNVPHSAVTLDIVGGYDRRDVYYRFLKKLVENKGLSNRIFFHGKVEESRMHSFYKDASIFAFPSLHEGYGMVLCEAMSFSLPIVASDIAPINEIVEDRKNGFLFPAGNSEALTKKLAHLIRNGELQDEIGLLNFQKSRTFPTWNDVVKQTYKAVEPFLMQ
jgi:glycosyltransferase involved in cell wall biosynthesis